MKVIHVPFGFFPEAVGGTEVYVESLARYLRALDIDSIVAAPGERTTVYTHGAHRVHRFAVRRALGDVGELYGGGDVEAAAEFGRILAEERADVVHVHAWTRGVSLRLVRVAKRRHLPVVFTYHTPTVSCERGTLMYWGVDVCDGRLDVRTCASCTLNGLGLSRASSVALGSLPSGVGRLLNAAGVSGGMWTALRMTELMQRRHSTVRALMAEVDRIVVLCEWARALLIRNGVTAEKIVVSPLGLPSGVDDGGEAPVLVPRDASLRVAYVGRLDHAKGPDVLIRALRSSPEWPMELHLYGVAQAGTGARYLQELETLAAGDRRIAFLPSVSNDRIVPLLRDYDVLAAPSRCLETGPLVVLEAFAARIPVVGSNLGGIAELVQHEVNGLLVEPDSLPGWCEAFRRLSEDRALLVKLRSGVRPPRRMTSVAAEMAALYAALRPSRSYRESLRV